jgi:hypothetical protein
MSSERFCLKAGATIVAAGMLTFCGCTETQVAETPKVIVMTTEKPVDSPTPRIITMTPDLVDEDNVETKKDDETEIPDSETVDLGDIFKQAPEIDGLNKEIQDEKVFYTYKEGNIYGGEVGEYAGVYKDNVTLDGKKVGGVCLEAKICHEILNNALDQIPKDKSEIKIIMPLDITKYEGDFKIEKISRDGLNWYGCFFDEDLSFVDTCFGNNLYKTNPESNDMFFITDNDNPIYINQAVCNWNCFTEDYFDMNRLFYYFSEGFLEYGSTNKSAFGKSLCQINSSLVIGLGVVVKEGNKSFFDATTMPDNSLLTISGKTIVFMEPESGVLPFIQEWAKDEQI